MIPDLDENGYLPPGIHLATIEEIEARFGRGSEEREAAMQSLLWLIPICRRAGIVRLILNGSFVTNAREPRDVDCILVPGPTFSEDSDAALEIEAGLPFLSLEIAYSPLLFSRMMSVFTSDRQHRAKGLVEVAL